MNPLALMLAMLSAGAAPAAQEQRGSGWRLNDEAAAADPSQASSDGFGVMMLVTPDYEGFLKAWEGPSPPRLTTTGTVTRARPVHGMLIFSGCRAGADGNCDVTARLEIIAPDGSAYGELPDAPVWRGPPAPGSGLQLSESNLGFVLEPEDALGPYTLKAAVTDRVAGTTVHVRQEVRAEKEAR